MGITVDIAYPLIKLTDSIAGIEQQFPADSRSVLLGSVDNERTRRASAGNLVSDILTTKKRWVVAYSYIDGDVFNVINSLRYTNNNLVMQFQETYGATVETYAVRIVAPLSRKRLLATGTGVFTDVTIEIEEV